MVKPFRHISIFTCIVILALAASVLATEPFVLNARVAPDDPKLEIKPWKTIDLDPTWGSGWVYLADVDGDNEPEIVSAQLVFKKVNGRTAQHTTAVGVQKLDGSLLWTWGDPKAGHKKPSCDVPCQVYDWDRDGKNEVIISTDRELIELDGATGKVKRSFPIPKGASDSITFCNLTDNPRGDDILIKDRYWNVYAYDYDGKQLWHSEMPGGYRTIHQAWPCDIDGDGRHEVIVGFQMLNPDGSVRWTIKGAKANLKKGHCDCIRVLKQGKRPEDWKFVLSACSADAIIAVDNKGKTIWEKRGKHYESIDVGDVLPEVPGLEIVVDVDHQPKGKSSFHLFDCNGNLLGDYLVKRGRHHALIDFNGDGALEIVESSSAGLFDGKGHWLGRFVTEPDDVLHTCHIGDMTGDGRPDITFKNWDNTRIYIYKNPSKTVPKNPAPCGVGRNFTLY